MKKNYIFVLLIFVLTSCSTDNKNKEPIPPISLTDCWINSITYSNEVFSYHYEGNKIETLTSSEREVVVNYDNQDRINGYEIKNIETAQIQFKKEYSYNNAGLLVEVRNYDAYMGDLIPTSKFEYEYDNSRLLRIKNYDLSSDTFEGKTEYSWENGNIVSSSFYDENNELECSTEYTFHNTKENQFRSDFTEFYYLELYDSDSEEALLFSKNLIESSVNLCSGENQLWDFTIDEKGFISEATFDSSTYWKITYNCN